MVEQFSPENEFKRPSPKTEVPVGSHMEKSVERESPDVDLDAWLVSSEHYERAYGMGPETESGADREVNRQKAKGVLQRLRQHPLTKPVFQFMTVVMGAGALGMGSIEKGSAGSDPEMDEIMEVSQDVGVQYELRKMLFEELLERDQVLDEREARQGREDWSQEEKIEYESIPSLDGKFEYLHKDDVELIQHYRSPEGRIKSFSAIVQTMKLEFSHTTLMREFTKTCVQDAPDVFAQMEPAEALALYQEFSQDLSKRVGILHVREMGALLMEKLPKDHPIQTQILHDGWMSDEVGEWFESSKENSALFDQANGVILLLHDVGDRKALLDTFPGNGGPPNGVAWERGMPGHVAVRTPDGRFGFDRVLEKKSVSWRNSWVADGAELRWANDKKDVEYKDQDGKWRLLTGDKAEFVVYGAPSKPFVEKNKSKLYKYASQQLEDGTTQVPKPFTVQDALGPDGELRPIWDRNDFGPKTIRIKDAEGKLMSIFFHSSPTDEAPEAFLDFSHGCIHMKPADLEAMGGYLAKGSDIKISSFLDIVAIAQIEKPGTMSEAREG
ncbi:L,D-transpeptidase [Candidatus Uhrbacteria bacterium]|nr:L,D-transpeptidase [Candidatus Uhrbacteria bacterium]